MLAKCWITLLGLHAVFAFQKFLSSRFATGKNEVRKSLLLAVKMKEGPSHG